MCKYYYFFENLFMEQFKQYLNSLPIDQQATMLKKLYQEMTAEQKIVILNEIESTLKIDYVIYGVGYEHRLMNDDKIDIIYNEIDLMGNMICFVFYLCSARVEVILNVLEMLMNIKKIQMPRSYIN